MDSRAIRAVQPTLLVIILLRHIAHAVPSVLQYQQSNEPTDSYAFGAFPGDPQWQNAEPAVETWPNPNWLPPASWQAPPVPYQWPQPQPLPWYPSAPAPTTAPPAVTTITVPTTVTTTTVTTTTTPPPTTTTTASPAPTTAPTTTAAAPAQPSPAYYPPNPPQGHYYPVPNWQYVPIVAAPQVPYPWEETYHYPVYYPAPATSPPSTAAASVSSTSASTPTPTPTPTTVPTTPTPTTTTTTTISSTTTAAPSQAPTTRYAAQPQAYYQHHHLPAAPPQYVPWVAPKPQRPYGGTSWNQWQGGSWRNGNNNDAVEQITSNDQETQQENLGNSRHGVDKRPCNPGNIPHGTLRRPTNSTGSANSRRVQGSKLVSERFLEACVDGRWTVVACNQTVSASAHAENEKIRRLECSVEETGGQASSLHSSTKSPSRDANLEQLSVSIHPTSVELQWQSFQSVASTPQDVRLNNNPHASSSAPEQHQTPQVPASAVALSKCRPGLTEADVNDSKAYRECILVGASSETGWVTRRCADGTVYSSAGRGCSRPAPASS